MNEGHEEKKSAFEIVPLTPEQYPVTPVPKLTTELPFFYLTKQKRLLDQDIHYEGIDGFGNPIRWNIIPNRSPVIGVPAIEAHTIWKRLVKPMMEVHRTSDGIIPEILPLGGIRKCLRILGWSDDGGFEANALFQGLMQVGQATCNVDFVLPTNDVDPLSGKPVFKTIKGIFNRFSIWKIGSKHVSEEELASGNLNFDFDLDDTLYIQLHKVERDIQRHQDQRYEDNEYSESVEPRARRWYELLCGKIFGSVKNNSLFCEIRYSWYVKHHHTLMRLYNRRRVMLQMNRVVGDHLASGFITKVEYFEIKDERGETDFIIRYYPGLAAKESVKRVLSFINSSNLPVIVERRRKLRAASAGKSERRRTQRGRSLEVSAQESSTVGSEPPQSAADLETFAALVSRGITDNRARELVARAQHGQNILDQIEWAEHQVALSRGTLTNPAGLIIKFVRENVTVPPTFQTSRQRKAREEETRRAEREEAEQLALRERYEAYREAEVDRYMEKLDPADIVCIKEAKAMEFRAQYSGLAEMRTVVESFVTRATRREIQKRAAILSFDEFMIAEKAMTEAAGANAAEAVEDRGRPLEVETIVPNPVAAQSNAGGESAPPTGDEQESGGTTVTTRSTQSIAYTPATGSPEAHSEPTL